MEEIQVYPIGSGSETNSIWKKKKKQRFQWRAVSDENRKESTKKWVIRTFYPNNTSEKTHSKSFALSDHQTTSSHHHSLAAHPILTDTCHLPNSQNPSINSPSMSYAEAFFQRNQSNWYRKRAENRKKEPKLPPPPKTSLYAGEPAIYFDESVINAKAEKFKYCLVGKFPYSFPSLTQIREWVAREWKLRGDWSVTLLDFNHIFIRLDNESDMIRLWVSNRWWINGHLMKVFKWTPQFRAGNGEPSSAAVWIALPRLPVVFFEEDVLFSISSLVGKPLAIDVPTKILSRTNVARICVEVDLLVEFPRRVWIGIGEGGFWQRIYYEKLPSYCLNCNRQGHSTKICKFNASNSVIRNSSDKVTNSAREILKTEINQPTKQDSCGTFDPNRGYKAASKSLIDDEPRYGSHNPGSQHTDVKDLRKTQIGVFNSDEFRSDIKSLVSIRSSENLGDHHSVDEVIRSKSADLKFSSNWIVDWHAEEEYRTSKPSVHKSMEGESSKIKHDQICDLSKDREGHNQLIAEAPSLLPSSPSLAFQHRAGHSVPIIKDSSQLPSNRVTIVEAMTRSLGTTENIKTGRQGFGGTFSTLSIMNATFLRTSTNHARDDGNKIEKEVMHVLKVGTERANLDEEIIRVGRSILEEEEEEKKFQSHLTDQHKPQGLQHSKNNKSKKSLIKQTPPTRMKLSLMNPIFIWKKKRENIQTQEILENYMYYLAKIIYKYSDIKAMTMSFRDEIGGGGFGSVFKGMLPDSRLVAVKVLERESCQGEIEFHREVEILKRADHVNIISLLGFCSEKSKRALIYDFMPNGSLDKFIFGMEPTGARPLGWETLHKIAVGIARGLEYLHYGCSMHILHLDVKPSNILLDQDFCPKISDFGLAELWPTKESYLKGRICGTLGYMAPELAMEGSVSDKSDVYGYGVTLLEMVEGRRLVVPYPNPENITWAHLVSPVCNRLDQRDLGLEGLAGVADEEIARKMILVGLWCIQDNAANRPSMRRVVEMLERSIDNLQMPPKPSFRDAMIYSSTDSGAAEFGAVDSFTDSLEGR
ncbi:uncharacterized protein LOC143853421 [Tasmannia lanceolata]|uniref:uncharacterized protein LOC143853421 n=1 Tax=Tasmannia lanceolata TaxID=3420 RepID=UPI004063D706